MNLKLVPQAIEDVVLVEHQVFRDARGFFVEAWHRENFRQAGLPVDFVQLNHSCSARNVVRGLHFQWEPPMGKMMRVTRGRAFLVAVDIRKGSTSLGQWVGVDLSAQDHKQLWAPAGFARGFAVLSEIAEIQYLCSGGYNPACESGIRWDDPEIGINWPLAEPLLSDKDATAMSLADWLASPASEHFRL